jgi:hypothetical protein
MLANDMLAPRPHIDPRKAAEVSDEEREDEDAEATEAAKDVFVVSEAEGDSAGAQGTQTQQPSLQKTAKTIERPAAARPAATPTPNTATPAPKSNGGAERPRRVSDRP